MPKNNLDNARNVQIRTFKLFDERHKNLLPEGRLKLHYTRLKYTLKNSKEKIKTKYHLKGNKKLLQIYLITFQDLI